MNADEAGLTMIKIIGTPSEIEIYDTDVINLLHLFVQAAQLYVLGQRLGHSVEDAFQIVELARELNFHQNNISSCVLSFDINSVELFVFLFLIALALKYFDYLSLLAEQHGD